MCIELSKQTSLDFRQKIKYFKQYAYKNFTNRIASVLQNNADQHSRIKEVEALSCAHLKCHISFHKRSLYRREYCNRMHSYITSLHKCYLTCAEEAITMRLINVMNNHYYRNKMFLFFRVPWRI